MLAKLETSASVGPASGSPVVSATGLFRRGLIWTARLLMAVGSVTGARSERDDASATAMNTWRPGQRHPQALREKSRLGSANDGLPKIHPRTNVSFSPRAKGDQIPGN